MKLGLLSIGQCGGNIALEAYERDLELLENAGEDYVPFEIETINSNEFDNQKLKEAGVSVRVLGDQEALKNNEGGAAKNRNISKNLLKKYGASLLMDIAKKFYDCQVIVANASTSGGTGSGELIMSMDIIRNMILKMDKENDVKDRKRAFIIYGIVPNINEDLKALGNSVEAIKEIAELNLPYILLDNSKVNSNNIKTTFDAINKSAVDDLRVLRGDFNSHSSKYGNIDFRDMITLISTPGLMSINKITGIKETDLSNQSLESLIIKSIKDSYNIQTEKDKVISRIGIILSVTESMLEKFDSSLKELTDEVGQTAFKQVHVNIVEDESQTSIITILAGMSCPDSKLSDFVEMINSAKSEVTKTKESKIKDLNQSINWFNDDDEAEEEIEEDIEDIFKKYK